MSARWLIRRGQLQGFLTPLPTAAGPWSAAAVGLSVCAAVSAHREFRDGDLELLEERAVGTLPAFSRQRCPPGRDPRSTRSKIADRRGTSDRRGRLDRKSWCSPRERASEGREDTRGGPGSVAAKNEGPLRVHTGVDPYEPTFFLPLPLTLSGAEQGLPVQNSCRSSQHLSGTLFLDLNNPHFPGMGQVSLSCPWGRSGTKLRRLCSLGKSFRFPNAGCFQGMLPLLLLILSHKIPVSIF